MSDKRLVKFGGMAAGISVLALVAAAVLAGGEARTSALLGVAVAAVSNGIAMAIKRGGAGRSLNWVLGVVSGIFALRAVLVTVALVWVVKGGSGPAIPFVIGFFGAYLPLQWVELAYVMGLGKDRGKGEG